MAQLEFLITEDGSHTLWNTNLNEHYHSIHGAIQESRHVFIDAGFLKVSKQKSKINILENANPKVNLLDPRFNSNVNTAKDARFSLKNGAENKDVETAIPSLLASLGGENLLSQIGLCGEKFPLDNPNASARLARTFQYYMNCRGALSHYLYMSGRYKADFVKALQRNGVPAEFYYLSIAESGYQI